MSIRSNVLKAVVMLALLCPATAFADGDMGGGGVADTDNPTKTTVSGEGDMGGGGRSATPIAGYLEALMDSVWDLLT